MATKKLVAELRAMCLALPGATEKLSHGSPAFFAGRTVRDSLDGGTSRPHLRPPMVRGTRGCPSRSHRERSQAVLLSPLRRIAWLARSSPRRLGRPRRTRGATGGRLSLRRLQTTHRRTRQRAVRPRGHFVRADGAPTQHGEVPWVDDEPVLLLGRRREVVEELFGCFHLSVTHLADQVTVSLGREMVGGGTVTKVCVNDDAETL